MKVAFLTYGDVPNPLSIPAAWPALRRELADGDEPLPPPYLNMTEDQEAAYVAEHQAEFDAWLLSLPQSVAEEFS